MEKTEKIAGDILEELEEIKKIEKNTEEDAASLTYDCGNFFTLVCC